LGKNKGYPGSRFSSAFCRFPQAASYQQHHAGYLGLNRMMNTPGLANPVRQNRRAETKYAAFILGPKSKAPYR